MRRRGVRRPRRAGNISAAREARATRRWRRARRELRIPAPRATRRWRTARRELRIPAAAAARRKMLPLPAATRPPIAVTETPIEATRQAWVRRATTVAHAPPPGPPVPPLRAPVIPPAEPLPGPPVLA